MNEVYLTQDGQIAKYVHEDSSETSIKTWPKDYQTCGGSGREKWNVFASCSVGCPIGCKFCFLTSKKFKYHKLSAEQIALNVISAIDEELIRRPELVHIPMNLSWMGMGDPWLDMKTIKEATQIILEYASRKVDQIEGVDLASTFPNIPGKQIGNLFYLHEISQIVDSLYNLTPKPPERSKLRLFYSLHAVQYETRYSMISQPRYEFGFFAELSKKFNVIFHCMFLEGINDKNSDIQLLLKAMEQCKDSQLRILRFNKCSNSQYFESDKFMSIIAQLNKSLGDRLKIQASPGSEVSAACGMFLMKTK